MNKKYVRHILLSAAAPLLAGCATPGAQPYAVPSGPGSTSLDASNVSPFATAVFATYPDAKLCRVADIQPLPLSASGSASLPPGTSGATRIATGRTFTLRLHATNHPCAHIANFEPADGYRYRATATIHSQVCQLELERAVLGGRAAPPAWESEPSLRMRARQLPILHNDAECAPDKHGASDVLPSPSALSG